MLKRNFNLCFSSIKCLPTSSSHPLTLDDDDDEQKQDYEPQETMKSFNSIYDVVSTSKSTSTTTAAPDSSSDDYTMESSQPHEPDLSTVFASQRFFVSSPGPSNSILDSAVVGGGVAVRIYSPDPYIDFRRSMEEMVRARWARNNNNDSDWEYLHELLLCYLSLNPKHTHNFIIAAFSDVLVSLVSPTGGRDHGREVFMG